MLSVRYARVNRHTRPADYMDRSRQARQVRSQRMNSRSFSFSGEFPQVQDCMPVQAPERRRQYTAESVDTGSYRAVGTVMEERVPVVSVYGVRFRAALLLCAAVLLVMGTSWLLSMSEASAIAKRIDEKADRIRVLTAANDEAADEIALRTDDVEINRAAGRMGLINSKGVDVIYLTAPDMPDDVKPTQTTASQALAGFMGQ